jgi:Tol biopolymer transport system component
VGAALRWRPKGAALTQTPFREIQGRFSPDGRLIAYVSNESGRDEVYVQTFPPSGSKWQISVTGGLQPRWRADGRVLFFHGAGMFSAVDITMT